MFCAFSDSVSIDTRISSRSPPRPSAATNHVLNRMDTSLSLYDSRAASCQYLRSADHSCPRARQPSSAASGRMMSRHPHSARWRAISRRRLLDDGDHMGRTAEIRIRDEARAASLWTAARLRRCLDTCCGGNRVVVLANREPFRHDWNSRDEPIATRSASGLVTALEPLVAPCRGVWVGHDAGSADRAAVTWRDGLNVPPRHPTYRLRHVWLDAIEERRYYGGFANEGLWPLCHRAGVTPLFRPEDFAAYARVNEKFAMAVAEEVDTDSPVVMVQDYHFALAPRMIRERLPESTVIAFWHIPWPRIVELERCPWRRELLHGLLASDVVGFQTDADCRAFLDGVARVLDSRVDRRRGTVWYDGRETIVRSYPISIEWPNRQTAASPPIDECRSRVAERLQLSPDTRLIVGADRLDYSKGLCEKALAFERLLDMC